MHRIIPHLWYDTEAKQAAEFYETVFQNSKVTNVSVLHDTPSGDCDVVSFTVRGLPFMAISAGPYFKINPSISFMVNFDPSREKDAQEQLDAAWEKLADGGKVRMEIGEYPFSKRYGWVDDKYGVSWQLILTDPNGEPRPTVVPTLLFVGNSYGKAEAAAKFYLSVFKDSPFGSAQGGSQLGTMMKYGPGQEPNKEGTVMFSDFRLLDTWFAAMDGGGKHDFAFNEAVSFIVKCKTQEEIDYYWEKLSAVPEAEQCGWLKDKFGISWQITPTAMDEMMNSGDEAKIKRVTDAFLTMKKFDIAALEKAAQG